MNSITVKATQTPYGYEESYLVIDNISLPQHLEQYAKKAQDKYIKKFGSLLGLCPAWGNKLLHKGETRFIWKLIEQDEPTVLPVLVCEDDLDLSCMVFVVFIQKDSQFVYWDKIGYVSHNNFDRQKELESGILHLESYTEEDWEKYGSNIAVAKFHSEEWKQWISKNWDEELYRRCMNYVLPYYQTDGNIVWLENTNWIFSREEYDLCVSYFKERL